VEESHKHVDGTAVKESDDTDRDQLIRAQADVAALSHDDRNGHGMESGLLQLVNGATTEYGTLSLST
jgi:hypothetical protein